MKTQGTIPVQTTPSMPLSRGTGAVLQRQCACGQHKPGGGECEECKKKRTTLQRQPAGHAEPAAVPPIVHDVLRSSGQPLEAGTRSFFESRFGEDFSHVRVHADERSADSARAVNARAYTVGSDVVFERGQYGPSTVPGRQLLAHELTHVVQQKGISPGAKLVVGPESDPCEQEADRIGASVMESRVAATSTSVESDLMIRKVQKTSTVQRSKKGAFLGALTGGLAGAVIGGLVGGVPGAIVGGLLGAAIGGLIGALVGGSKVSVDKSCGKFCSSLDVANEAKKTDSKAASGCKNVKFTYQVAGKPTTQKFDQKVDLNHVTVKCDASNANCGGWSSKGIITLGKAACNAGTCGPLASSILHEMVHDWAGWGPPYDKQNVTVPGASHKTPDYLDEWVARYVEKSCFSYNPWGLP
jgi:Domain of unknown function (DUF4157)